MIVAADVHGVVVAVQVQPGDVVAAGQTLALLESMKMEVPVQATGAGVVRHVTVTVGDVVKVGDALMTLAPVVTNAETAMTNAETAVTPRQADEPTEGQPRPALATLFSRRALLLDGARPQAMAARHASGRLSVRDSLALLLDAGSFTEYGGFAVAAQRSRRDIDELQRQTPADGLITGTGTVNADQHGAARGAANAAANGAVAVMAYDYTVLAGTQGAFNHRKSDRLLELAARQQLPVVLLAEGGGGRPGDVDAAVIAGLHCTTFARFAALSGQVPLVGVVAGRCFAGNAALLGCCEVIIASEGSSIGMGGPAMIEGGGLGRVHADAVGPLSVLAPNGVIDVRVADDAAAIAAARRYLGYFQGKGDEAACAGGDVTSLRQALPLNRNALYDPRRIIETLADAGSVMELRAEFGIGVITVLARLRGRTVAIAASQPRHLGGALDAPACDKLARFMQLADARGVPLVTLVDTPGFMVGPASEQTAMVRHAARLFVTAAALRVPVASVVLRRGYGLGAMALTAGHFHAPVATCAWPQAEFGAMGIEGSVRLGFRRELEAAGVGREALFERLVQQAISRGQALNMASHLEIDDVIDPAETRDWLVRVLDVACAAPLPPRRPFIDTW